MKKSQSSVIHVSLIIHMHIVSIIGNLNPYACFVTCLRSQGTGSNITQRCSCAPQ